MGKMCPNCGNILSDQAKFCPKCGTKQETQTRQEGKFCLFCGATLEPGARFCSSCGRDLMAAKKGNGGAVHSNVSAADYVKSGFDKVAGTLNEKIGESGPVKVHLSDLVSEVFKKHTMEETEELFIAGTKKTTPKESEITATWPKPWLYSRVLLFLAVTSLILYFILIEFHNPNAYPGFIFMGAMLVGFVEEAGKIVVVAYYMRKTNSKYILNGLLLGACVGAGFAVFESAGYAFQCLLSTGADSAMMDITLLRGVLAVGGHVVWTAIAGAALAAAKGEEMFNIQQLISGRFLFFFAISVILHGVWDCPLQFLGAYGKYIVLIVLAWVVTLTLISSGLKQITRLAQQKGNENQ